MTTSDNRQRGFSLRIVYTFLVVRPPFEANLKSREGTRGEQLLTYVPRVYLRASDARIEWSFRANNIKKICFGCRRSSSPGSIWEQNMRGI